MSASLTLLLFLGMIVLISAARAAVGTLETKAASFRALPIFLALLAGMVLSSLALCGYLSAEYGIPGYAGALAGVPLALVFTFAQRELRDGSVVMRLIGRLS